MSRKIAFIINPNAGVKKKIDIIDFIRSNFNTSLAYDLIVWKNKDDFEDVKQQILKGNYDTVVACGGDGTVNLVSSVVMNSNMALGILPLGSGNGLARTNAIPLDLKQALRTIEAGNVAKIDSARMNNQLFFCTAGIGFDALIANKFASSTTRGFATYFKTSVKEFFSYKPNSYTVTVDGQSTQLNAFLITVANAGQWGNNVYIAPKALINDGILHVAVLQPFSKMAIPGIGVKLFSGNIHTSRSFRSFEGKKISIEFNGTLPVHFDGEPIYAENRLDIEIIPSSLTIIRP